MVVADAAVDGLICHKPQRRLGVGLDVAGLDPSNAVTGRGSKEVSERWAHCRKLHAEAALGIALSEF